MEQQHQAAGRRQGARPRARTEDIGRQMVEHLTVATRGRARVAKNSRRRGSGREGRPRAARQRRRARTRGRERRCPRATQRGRRCGLAGGRRGAWTQGGGASRSRVARRGATRRRGRGRGDAGAEVENGDEARAKRRRVGSEARSPGSRSWMGHCWLQARLRWAGKQAAGWAGLTAALGGCRPAGLWPGCLPPRKKTFSVYYFSAFFENPFQK